MYSAYIDEWGKEESLRSYKKRLYNTPVLLNGPRSILQGVRIQQKWPHHNWKTIWSNLHVVPVSDTMRGEWFKIIHDLTPTNARLHAIHVSPTDKCARCGEIDTLQHRITDCVEGQQTWEWACAKMAMMIRKDPRYIPKEWVLRPHFNLWLPQKHRAILWALVQLAIYRTQHTCTPTKRDFMDFLRRSRWKTYQGPNWRETLGQYLSVIDLWEGCRN
jgi:hypothetical protein